MRSWTGSLLALALVGAALTSGCSCGTRTQRRSPALEEAAGALDFGAVQVDATHRLPLRVRNGGTALLRISGLEAGAPFGVENQVPVELGIGEAAELVVTYTPTVAGVRHVGELRIESDDPDRPSVTVLLSGRGVQVIATASPSPLAFGEVYVGESKTVDLVVQNAGSATLEVLSASFIDGAPGAPVLQADLTSLTQPVPPAGSTTTAVTFTPAGEQTLGGALRLELSSAQGGELVVPLSGRGIRAVPRLCFRPAGAGTERCTPADFATTSLDVDFGPLCDRLVSPSDGGPSACGADVPYQASGQLYLRNEGNVPFTYSLKVVADGAQTAGGNPCDGGVPFPPDFEFGNSPDAGVIVWTEQSRPLPAVPTDPKPWESAPILVTYRPSARCHDDAADQARVEITRQGDLRPPAAMFAFFSGSSLLPEADGAAWSCGALGSPQSVPCTAPFFGATNNGPAPFAVTAVDFLEVLAPGPGGSCLGVDAGFPVVDCGGADAGTACLEFAWAPGGDPNAAAPHTVPPPDGGPGRVPVGTLTFGRAGQTPPNQAICVHAQVSTTDPFRPTLYVKLQGVASP